MKAISTAGMVAALGGLLADSALAQKPPARQRPAAVQRPAQVGPGTTVQLPTLRFFGTSSSVLVPDRGQVYLGGIGRAGFHRDRAGVPLLPGASQSIGAGTSAAGMSISAWIHDFEAMDEAILQQAAAERGGAPVMLEPPPHADFALATQDSGLESVAEARRRREQVEQSHQQEMLDQLEKARSLRAEGKEGVARIYYQMALRRASDDLKQQIAAEMSAGNSKSQLTHHK